MGVNLSKRRLKRDFFGALENEISEEMQSDPDFQVYACDRLNELIETAKEIDSSYGRLKSGWTIVEEDKQVRYSDFIEEILRENNLNERFEQVVKFLMKNKELVDSQPSIAGALFVRAVEVARSDALKLLFKMSTTI